MSGERFRDRFDRFNEIGATERDGVNGLPNAAVEKANERPAGA